MAAITFDTLAYAKLLKDAGMEASQAEALANAQKQALEEAFNSRDLATKGDIARLDNKMALLASDIDAKMSCLETRLTRWFLTMTITIIGVIAALFAVSAAFLSPYLDIILKLATLLPNN